MQAVFLLVVVLSRVDVFKSINGGLFAVYGFFFLQSLGHFLKKFSLVEITTRGWLINNECWITKGLQK